MKSDAQTTLTIDSDTSATQILDLKQPGALVGAAEGTVSCKPNCCEDDNNAAYHNF